MAETLADKFEKMGPNRDKIYEHIRRTSGPAIGLRAVDIRTDREYARQKEAHKKVRDRLKERAAARSRMGTEAEATNPFRGTASTAMQRPQGMLTTSSPSTMPSLLGEA